MDNGRQKGIFYIVVKRERLSDCDYTITIGADFLQDINAMENFIRCAIPDIQMDF